MGGGGGRPLLQDMRSKSIRLWNSPTCFIDWLELDEMIYGYDRQYFSQWDTRCSQTKLFIRNSWDWAIYGPAVRDSINPLRYISQRFTFFFFFFLRGDNDTAAAIITSIIIPGDNCSFTLENRARSQRPGRISRLIGLTFNSRDFTSLIVKCELIGIISNAAAKQALARARELHKFDNEVWICYAK